jgi:catechol-2,3-dioxygenase
MAGDRVFDRSAEDLGNIIGLEHVNVKIPDQIVATNFYVTALGLTRDPYIMTGTENMWINAGQQQFHMPTGKPEVLRGTIGFVVPDLEALKMRLTSAREKLGGTKFMCGADDKYVSVTCPWGNKMRFHAPGPEFGEMTLGIPYVEFNVRPNTAVGIAKFYQVAMGAPATVTFNGNTSAKVQVGVKQHLIFRETTEPEVPYDGHHIAIYVTNFSGPHRWLKDRGLISEESNPVQYRFKDIVDPETSKVLFTIEHEVRSATHPMFMRPLVSRNAGQQQRTYQRGRDAYYPGAN